MHSLDRPVLVWLQHRRLQRRKVKSELASPRDGSNRSITPVRDRRTAPLLVAVGMVDSHAVPMKNPLSLKRVAAPAKAERGPIFLCPNE
jgi:hypothetical protein